MFNFLKSKERIARETAEAEEAKRAEMKATESENLWGCMQALYYAFIVVHSIISVILLSLHWDTGAECVGVLNPCLITLVLVNLLRLGIDSYKSSHGITSINLEEHLTVRNWDYIQSILGLGVFVWYLVLDNKAVYSTCRETVIFDLVKANVYFLSCYIVIAILIKVFPWVMACVAGSGSETGTGTRTRLVSQV